MTEEEGENQTPEAEMRRTGAIFCADILCFNIAAHLFKSINHYKISSSAPVKNQYIYTYKM